MNHLKQLKESRAAVEQKLRELHASVGENQPMNDEQRGQWNTLSAELEKFNTDIAAEEKREALVRTLAGQSPAASESEQDKRDKAKYSYMRALNIARGDQNRDGIEWEMSQEARNNQKQSGIVSKDSESVIIPAEFIRMEKRAHTASTDTQGGHAVPTVTGEIIPFLNAQPVVVGLGATVFTDLVGEVKFPRNDNSFVMDWKDEAADADEKSATFDAITLSPKELTGYLTISKQLMMQSGSAEGYIRGLLGNAIARSFDSAAINGSGSSPVPTGILNTVGIGSVAGGTNGLAPTWAHIVNLVKEVEVDNALLGNLAFLSTPGIKGKLAQTPKQSSGVEGNFIMNDPSQLYGYGFTASNLVPSTLSKGTSTNVCHAIIFGNWAELMLAMWGGVELFVDPYSKSKSREVQIVATMWGDVAVKHAQSFAAMKDALIS